MACILNKPSQNCVPGAPIYGLDYYLNHVNTIALAQWGYSGVQTSLQNGLNVSMTEFNSVSCGGIPGLSNTFVSVLIAPYLSVAYKISRRAL